MGFLLLLLLLFLNPPFSRGKKKSCVTPLDEACIELLSPVYTVLYKILHMEEA